MADVGKNAFDLRLVGLLSKIQLMDAREKEVFAQASARGKYVEKTVDGAILGTISLL